MSTELGKAYVQIIPSAQGISGSIQKVMAPEAAAAGAMAGKQVSGGMAASMGALGGKFMKAGAIATAVSVPIIAGIKKAMGAYAIQNMAETKLTEIYKTRMGASEKAAQSTMKVASALQKEGIIGDEVALSGSQQLATFAKYPKTINTLMPAMNNLLAQQKGVNATTQDATNIGNLMGKVLQGQTGALKRVGISFDENQEKILKYGTEEERAATLAEVITSNVGNMNKVMAETPEGKIQQMKNAMGDLAETLGATLAPALASIAQYMTEKIIPKVQSFMDYLKAHPAIGKIIVGITGVLAVGGPLLMIIGSIMKNFGALTRVLKVALGAFGGIAGIIMAVVGIFVIAYQKNEAFRKTINSLVSSLATALKPALNAIMGAVKTLMPIVTSIIKTLASALAPIIKALTPVLTMIAKTIARIAQAVLPILIRVIKTIAPIIKSMVKVIVPIVQTILTVFTKVFKGIAKVVGPVFKTVKTLIVTPIKAVLGVIKTVVGGIKKFLKFTGLGKKVSKCFNAIKGFITGPIKKAKETISGVIEKIKGWFPIDLGKIFKFKLPKIGKKYTKEKGVLGFGISWRDEGGKKKTPHAAGGIFSGRTIAVMPDGLHEFGEAGNEAIVPLDPFWKKMDTMTAAAQTSQVNNFYITVDGASNPEEFADRLMRRVKQLERTV